MEIGPINGGSQESPSTVRIPRAAVTRPRALLLSLQSTPVSLPSPNKRNAPVIFSTRRLGPSAGATGTSTCDADLRIARVQQLLEYWRDCELRKTSLQLRTDFPPVPMPHYGSSSRRYPTRWLTQFIVVAERAWLFKLRSPDALVSQFVASVVLSVLMGSFFYAMPLTQVSRQCVNLCLYV